MQYSTDKFGYIWRKIPICHVEKVICFSEEKHRTSPLPPKQVKLSVLYIVKLNMIAIKTWSVHHNTSYNNDEYNYGICF